MLLEPNALEMVLGRVFLDAEPTELSSSLSSGAPSNMHQLDGTSQSPRHWQQRLKVRVIS